jgi:hypothetical protein
VGARRGLLRPLCAFTSKANDFGQDSTDGPGEAWEICGGSCDEFAAGAVFAASVEAGRFLWKARKR